MQSRRNFLRNTMLAGAACSVANSLKADVPATAAVCGAPMLGFRCKPLECVRVGVVGIGSRGMGMINRVSKLPGVVVAAVCDIQDDKINKAKQSLARQKRPEPKVYKGPEAFRALCDSGDVDVIYNSTPWHLHVPVALAAMNGGKHVLTEVTAAFTVEDCWKMVETAEKRKVHCMQLENCIYGEIEMLTFNLAKLGMLGEIVHAEGAYNHDGRHMANDLFPAYQYWRYDWYREHVGGKTIMLQHTVSVPRPYSRLQRVQGTRGIIADYPYRIALEGDGKYYYGSGAHAWWDAKRAEEIRQKYKHPLWKTIGEIAKKSGGHGGMDYIQDARWSYCLRMGLPLDTSVYDLATTGCLCELTEKSATNRSQAMDVPDFTRGAWKTAPKMEVVDIDLKNFKI